MKIGIGGSSSGDGVKFISDNYTAKFVMRKDNSYNITVNKRVQIEKSGKLRKALRRIPLIKGLYSLVDGSPFGIFFFALCLFVDFAPIDRLEDNEIINNALGSIIKYISFEDEPPFYMVECDNEKCKNTSVNCDTEREAVQLWNKGEYA